MTSRTTRELACLFCKRRISFSYQVLGNVPIMACKCGSLCLLSNTKGVSTFLEHGIHVDSSPYKLDLSPETIATLIEEDKIREQVMEVDENGTPLISLIEVFPLTDDELNLVFTPKQVNVIKKNLMEALNVKEHKNDLTVLSRIRSKKKGMLKKHEIISKLFL